MEAGGGGGGERQCEQRRRELGQGIAGGWSAGKDRKGKTGGAV